MRTAEWTLEVHPGDGLVARRGDAVLAMFGDVARPEAQELLATFTAEATQGTTARELIHKLVALMTATPPDAIPDFCVLIDSTHGPAALMHGRVVLRASGPGGEEQLSGAGRPTWVDDYLADDVARIELTATGDRLATAASPFELNDGIVPAGGLVLVRGAGLAPGVPDLREEVFAAAAQAASVPEPVAPEPTLSFDVPTPEPEPTMPPEVPEPEPEPAAAPFQTIDLDAPADTAPRAPLPMAGGEEAEGEADVTQMVDGLRCIRGHFNHPEASFCAHCGISMVQQTHNIVQGARPPLGILVFEDGFALSLDADYVLGRDPSLADPVIDGTARPMVLDDPDQVLSRIHAEIRRIGWDVELVDRNSANGTFVRHVEDGEWERLVSSVGCILTAGMRAKLGPHEFVFESHHRPQHA